VWAGAGGGAGAACAAGGGIVALTAVLQAGDRPATFFCRQASASALPGVTPEHFAMKSERQFDRSALCWAELSWAAAPSIKAESASAAAAAAIVCDQNPVGKVMIFLRFGPGVTVLAARFGAIEDLSDRRIDTIIMVFACKSARRGLTDSPPVAYLGTKETVMAMDAVEIERLIKEGIPDAQVTIRDLAGDGNHYAATVLAPSFKGKSRVQQHQLVYQALKGQMGGVLHALALQTGTP
jgi:stress-induced morphogen